MYAMLPKRVKVAAATPCSFSIPYLPPLHNPCLHFWRHELTFDECRKPCQALPTPLLRPKKDQRQPSKDEVLDVYGPTALKEYFTLGHLLTSDRIRVKENERLQPKSESETD